MFVRPVISILILVKICSAFGENEFHRRQELIQLKSLSQEDFSNRGKSPRHEDCKNRAPSGSPRKWKHSHDSRDKGHYGYRGLPSHLKPDCGEICIGVAINEKEDRPRYNADPVEFDFGDTVVLRCHSSLPSEFSWKDKNNFRIRSVKAIRVTPDELDTEDSLTFTCSTNRGENTHVILTPKTSAEEGQSLGHEFVFLGDGESWTNNTCVYGIIHYPEHNLQRTSFRWKKNENVIDKFNGNLNGTMFECINFKPITENGESIATREKTIFEFYLNNSAKAERSQVEEVPLTPVTAEGDNIIIVSDSSNNTAIVGSVLGTIVIILLALIVGFWYKYIRRGPDQEANHVIYAEIENGLSGPPPPPPRNPEPYAEIIGVLTPKQNQPLERNVKRQSQDPPATVKRQSQDRGSVKRHNQDRGSVKRESQNPYMIMT